MAKIDLNKTFYLIAKYWLGDLQGFIKIGDDKEEITRLFEEKYMWKPNMLGITEESYKLLAVNAEIIMTDQDYWKKQGVKNAISKGGNKHRR